MTDFIHSVRYLTHKWLDQLLRDLWLSISVSIWPYKWLKFEVYKCLTICLKGIVRFNSLSFWYCCYIHMTSRINRNVCMYVRMYVCMYVCIEITIKFHLHTQLHVNIMGHLVDERQEYFAERRTPSDSSCRPQLEWL